MGFWLLWAMILISFGFPKTSALYMFNSFGVVGYAFLEFPFLVFPLCVNWRFVWSQFNLSWNITFQKWWSFFYSALMLLRSSGRLRHAVWGFENWKIWFQNVIYTTLLLLIAEAFWRLAINENQDGGGVAQSNLYPDRPGEPDCIYYLRTGLCGYGSNCRFNHPKYISQVIKHFLLHVGHSLDTVIAFDSSVVRREFCCFFFPLSTRQCGSSDNFSQLNLL